MPLLLKQCGIALMLLHSFFFQIFAAQGIPSVALLFVGFILVFVSRLSKVGGSICFRIMKFRPEQLAWVVLLVWCVLGNYNLFNRDSFNGVLLFTLATIMLLWDKPDWGRFFMNCLLAFALVHAFFTVLFFFVPALNHSITAMLSLVKEQSSYISGVTNHYSTNSLYISVGMLAAFAKVYSGQKRWVFPAVFFLFANLLTSKRGPLLFSVIALVVCYFVVFKVRLRTILVFVASLALIAFIISRVALGSPEVLYGIERIMSSFSGLGTNAAAVLSGRDMLYREAWRMFLHNPLLGRGWGAFIAITGLPMAHNIYLQMLAECGIIGFIVLMFCLVKSLFMCAKPFLFPAGVALGGEARFYLMFSLAMQVFFILYGLTGNPLYDGVITIPVLLSYALCYGTRRSPGLPAYDPTGIRKKRPKIKAAWR